MKGPLPPPPLLSDGHISLNIVIGGEKSAEMEEQASDQMRSKREYYYGMENAKLNSFHDGADLERMIQ